MNDSRLTAVSDAPECWPELPLESWKDTLATLHMWMQIVGKVRLALTPRTNHWWNVTLYVNSRGLTTSAIPCGEKIFEVQFDFTDHQLLVQCNDGGSAAFPLTPRTVADFYREFMATLDSLGIEVKIWRMPVEILSVDEVFKQFSARFIGKASPVHFFWGAMDLAVTRFSGRRAPERNDPDPVLRKIMLEAYSHEVISAGFWPGGGDMKGPAFYCYAAPEPAGFTQQKVHPEAAVYNAAIGEYLLMYDDVRSASSPSATLLEFLQSTYEAGATTGKWDREALERQL